jgi:hypothetical protein
MVEMKRIVLILRECKRQREQRRMEKREGIKWDFINRRSL